MSKILSLVLFFSFPSLCLSWDGTLIPTSVIKEEVGCKGKLADRIYTGQGYIDEWLYPDNSDLCLSDEFNYMDIYSGVLVAACNEANTVRVVNESSCWPDSGSFPGVVTPGYCCDYYSTYPVCLGGSPVITCAEITDYSRTYVLEQVESVARWPYKAYFGERIYRGVNNPAYRAIYRIYGEDLCNDEIELVRTNDDVVAGGFNNEVYQYYANRRGVHTPLDTLMSVSLWENYGPYPSNFDYVYKGSRSSLFTHSDIIDNYGNYDPDADRALRGGLFEFIVNVVGTQCDYYDYRYVMAPETWTDCSSWDVKNWGDNYIGYDFGYSGPYRSYWVYPDHESFRAFEIWRYPVDDYYNAVGPIELYNSVAMGMSDWGYFSAPGGGDPDTDILLEDGYMYRFRSDIDGFVWSTEFPGWFCPDHGGGGSAFFTKSRISQQKITDHTMGGAYERRY